MASLPNTAHGPCMTFQPSQGPASPCTHPSIATTLSAPHLSPGTLISCTSLGCGLLPTPGWSSWALLPPPEHAPVTCLQPWDHAREWVDGLVPCSHLSWTGSPTPADPWYFPSYCTLCQVSCLSFGSWSIGQACCSGSKWGIRFFHSTEIFQSVLEDRQ